MTVALLMPSFVARPDLPMCAVQMKLGRRTRRTPNAFLFSFRVPAAHRLPTGKTPLRIPHGGFHKTRPAERTGIGRVIASALASWRRGPVR